MQGFVSELTKAILKGCNGGLYEDAFAYIKKIGGLDTEKSYPYEHGKIGKCRYNPHHRGARVTGFTGVTGGDENALKHAVAKKVDDLTIYCWISGSNTLTDWSSPDLSLWHHPCA